ncbi:hypothetical protein HAL_16520 [Haladaptatus sp. T7]|nr:hypothetical protein HAL_16520 [Haladaptatus sp. T7]
MHSKKLEDISNSNLTRISSYLSELYSSDVARFRLSDMVKGADITRVEAFSVIEYLIEEDTLKPLVEVRCPICDQREGIYKKKSDIPSRDRSEFCGHSFNTRDQSNWEVVYSFEGGLNSDFFRNSVIV